MNLFLKTKTLDVTTEIRAINDDAFMPILGEEFSSVLDRSRPELCHLLQGFGSPLNLLFPYTFRENLRAMQAAFNRVAIDGRVMYAAKVNRSKCFFNICASERIGVDVSSLQELEAALAAGVNGELCLKWHTEFGHLNRGDMLTSEQYRCSNEKKKF
jgi:diaminopimelate decarboxylase